MKRTAMLCTAAITLVLVLAAAMILPTALAAPGAPGQQPAPQQPPPQQPPVQPGQQAPAEPQPPPVDPEEEAAYQAFFEVPATDPRRKVELGEQFLGKYPASRYTEAVYTQLVTSYMAVQEEDKMFAAGEKALALNPDHVDVLALMALTLSRRIDTSQLDAAQKMARVERYARHGIELLQGMQKPAQLTEEQFAQARDEKLAMCHSGLGMIHILRNRFADAAGDMEKAVELSATPEVVDLYLLGVAYENTQRFAQAADAYRRCGEVQSGLADRCRQGQARAEQKTAGQSPPPAR